MKLTDVREVTALAEEVVVSFRRDFAPALADLEVHHIGATAMPFGHTKGDVDVNVRVEEERFPLTIGALQEQCGVAQPANWTPRFASFASTRYALPLGVQVTVFGSADDFLVALCDHLREDPELLRAYDDRKLEAAPRGENVYWSAKNDFLRAVLRQLGR